MPATLTSDHQESNANTKEKRAVGVDRKNAAPLADTITLIPGDGIGAEIAHTVQRRMHGGKPHQFDEKPGFSRAQGEN